MMIINYDEYGYLIMIIFFQLESNFLKLELTSNFVIFNFFFIRKQIQGSYQ